MRRIQIFVTALAIMILFATFSCSRFEDFRRLDQLDTTVEFNPQLVAPLAYGSFTLQDVLEAVDSTGLISQYEDSLLYIYYQDTAYSVIAGDILELPDKFTTRTYIESDINIPGWLALPDGDTLTFTKTDTLDFTIEEGDILDSIIFKNGNLNIEVSSEFRHSGELAITSPDIRDENGDTLDITFTISQTDGSYYSNTDYSMIDYKVETQHIGDSSIVRINYKLSLKKESGVPILVGEEASMVMTFEDMEFRKIFGFIVEREVLDISESVEIDFIDQVADIVDIFFKDPQLNLYVDNSYGISSEIDLSMITARSAKTGETLPLRFVHDSLNVVKIDAPGLDQLGETVTTVKYINAETSNIDSILASAPNRFDFDITASTGSPPENPVENFVLDTSKIDIMVEIVLPMWLQTSGYELQDTIDFDLGEIAGDLGFIDSAKLTMYTVNEFPLEVKLQGYFLDAQETVLDSLFEEGQLALLNAAPVDEITGEILSGQLEEESFDIDFTGDELMNISDAVELWIKATAATTDDGTSFVKFFSHYELSYRLSLNAAFTINPEELDFGE